MQYFIYSSHYSVEDVMILVISYTVLIVYGHSSKHFAYVNLFNPYNITVRLLLALAPFQR